MYKRIRNQSISIDLQLRLFDSIVEPILLYGSEVWGFENTIDIERIHLQFCKNILHLRKSTPYYMVYGELGLFPLSINIKMRMVGFWNRLVSNEHKLSSHLYRLMFSLHNSGVHEFKWIKSIQNIFNNTGLGYIFNFHGVSHLYQGGIPFISYKLLLKQQLHDQFMEKWFSDVMNSSKGKFYSIFKKELELEKYLLRLPSHYSVWITKLRTSNLKLPIEVGRWYGIPKENRHYTLCLKNIGDEFQVFFQCENDVISDFRIKFIPSYYCKNANVQTIGGGGGGCKLSYSIIVKCSNCYCILCSLSYICIIVYSVH